MHAGARRSSVGRDASRRCGMRTRNVVPCALGALDVDREAVVVDDALHHGEPDAHAVRARREERVEEPLPRLRRDARAVDRATSSDAPSPRPRATRTRHRRARRRSPGSRCARGSRRPAAAARRRRRRARGVGPLVAHARRRRRAPDRRASVDDVARELATSTIDGPSGRARAREVHHVADEIVQARRLALDDVAELPVLVARASAPSRRSSIEPAIEPSGLRISCARPAASRPSAASRSACSARAVATSTSRPPVVAQALGEVAREQRDDARCRAALTTSG